MYSILYHPKHLHLLELAELLCEENIYCLSYHSHQLIEPAIRDYLLIEPENATIYFREKKNQPKNHTRYHAPPGVHHNLLQNNYLFRHVYQQLPTEQTDRFEDTQYW